jgi:hypothetical protein
MAANEVKALDSENESGAPIGAPLKSNGGARRLPLKIVGQLTVRRR